MAPGHRRPAPPTGRVRAFALPDLGEGLTEGEILQWLVAEGDRITLNQPIVEVETAKAAVEVPSPYAGVVVALHHQAGATVDVGSPLLTVDTEPDAGPLPADTADGAAAADEDAAAAAAAGAAAGADAGAADRAADPGTLPAGTAAAADLVPDLTATGTRTAVLVGYGVRPGQAVRRPRRTAAVAPQLVAGAPPAVWSRPTAAQLAAAAEAAAAPAAATAGVLAKPPVRRLARDLGVDLGAVLASGPHGSITRDDVRAAAAAAAAPADGPALAAGPAPAAPRDPVGAPVGGRGERREPIRGVRKLTAANMVASAFTAPHVTLFQTVDVTESMALLDRLRPLPEFAGARLSPLVLVARALLVAVRRHPEINARWDEARGEIVYFDYVHLGIAAATPRGLLVPNVKDADLLTLPALAHALTALADTARAGRTSPADMTGGTLTITNVGSFGVDNGTPILNPGEAAILCLGAIRDTAWVHQGQLAVRAVTQLTLSFDHRLVDGALGAAVLADLAAVLTEPVRLLAWG